MKCDKCGKELKPTVIGFNSNSPEYYQCDCNGTGIQPEKEIIMKLSNKMNCDLFTDECKYRLCESCNANKQKMDDHSLPFTPLMSVEPEEEVLNMDKCEHCRKEIKGENYSITEDSVYLCKKCSDELTADINKLKPCPLCGRPAVRSDTQTETDTKGLLINLTTIRCEGKTYKTADIKGCNVRCSSSNTSVAIRMWNKRV